MKKPLNRRMDDTVLPIRWHSEMEIIFETTIKHIK